MPVTSVTTDPASLTMTTVADYPRPVRRVWDAYADPRQLEKFWGPSEWPATFARHDMATDGWSHYWMTGPDGETSAGYWQFLTVDPLHGFEVRDGFANPDGTPNPEMPSMRMVFTFEETPDGTRVTDTTYFDSVEDLDTVLTMGMEEGTRSAMGQIDAVLDDLASFAAGRGTESRILSDTQVRVSRIIRGDVEQVWRAHHEPELVQRWLLGPEGWTMPVCEVATNIGDTYRYEWEKTDGTERFGFTGQLTESQPPAREVTTEAMIGTDGPSTLNELTLTPLADGTLLSVVITYPGAEVRDVILGTGMVDGMETSYARLEELITGASVSGS